MSQTVDLMVGAPGDKPTAGDQTVSNYTINFGPRTRGLSLIHI